MENIPDFNPSAYSVEALEVLDLERLSHAFDATQTVRALVESNHRKIREALDGPNRASRSSDELEQLRRDLVGATKSVALIRMLATNVRRTFSTRLRKEYEGLGYLVGSAVFRASKDNQGIERIQLGNSPSPRTEQA